MKKRISILLVLLAGFIFMVHSIVPHHHHKENICFEVSHQDSIKAEQPQKKSQSSGKENNKNAPCCAVQIEMIVPLNHVKVECFKFYIHSNQKISNTWLVIGHLTLINNSLYFSNLRDILFNQDIFFDYNQPSHSFGLRAPPIA